MIWDTYRCWQIYFLRNKEHTAGKKMKALRLAFRRVSSSKAFLLSTAFAAFENSLFRKLKLNFFFHFHF